MKVPVSPRQMSGSADVDLATFRPLFDLGSNPPSVDFFVEVS